jgi:hypothetical protein
VECAVYVQIRQIARFEACAPRVILVSSGRHEGAGITEGETTMARKTNRQAETRDDWRRLIPPLVANAAEIPHLEAPRIRLEAIDTETGELLLLQADLTAKKQEVSKRLQVLVTDGRQLAAFLRAGVKQHYGNRSEKLSAFNLQPFRGRKAVSPEKAAKKKKLQEETPAVPAPETSTE